MNEKSMSLRQRMALVGLALGIASGLTAAVVSIGAEARWPGILTLYFSGFTAGASLVTFVWRRSGPPAGRGPTPPRA